VCDILQDLVYEGRRLQINRTSKRQSKTSERRSPLRQLENPLHNGKRLNAITKQNLGAIQHISANRCDWLIDLRQWQVLEVILYVSGTQYTPFAYFTIKTKAYNVIISGTVQLWLRFKNIFCLNSIVEQYNIIAKFGTFLMSHPVYFTCLPFW